MSDHEETMKRPKLHHINLKTTRLQEMNTSEENKDISRRADEELFNRGEPERSRRAFHL